MIGTALLTLLVLMALAIPVAATLGVLGLVLEAIYAQLPLVRAMGEVSWSASNEFLLVSVMLSDIEGLADRLSVRPPEGDDPVERVIDVLRRANRALQREPQVTVAMIRALVSGNQDIAPAVTQTRVLMRRIISDALGASTDGAGADDELLMSIDLLSAVWMSALVEWISGVTPASAVVPKLESATRVLLG